ncbi:MAG: transglutaminase domain-containing protein [Hyphomicrobiaceae bacterium]
MRIRIRHETSYAYTSPARSALQLLRLTPRSSEGQFVRRWRVEVDVDARLDRSEDAFGNITHLIFIDGPIKQLNIVAEGDVHTRDMGGIILGTLEKLPLTFYLRGTSLTQPSEPLRRFARGHLAAEGGNLLAAMHALNSSLYENMAFDLGATSAATPAGEAFARKEGVCQDFAHILIAAARSIGAPARYVSGYFMRTDRGDQEAGHAWAEVHFDGLGWVGFDPAHGMCVTDQHVRVAVGADYCDAAPVRGAQFGGREEQLGVNIEVTQGQQIVES